MASASCRTRISAFVLRGLVLRRPISTPSASDIARQKIRRKRRAATQPLMNPREPWCSCRCREQLNAGRRDLTTIRSGLCIALKLAHRRLRALLCVGLLAQPLAQRAPSCVQRAPGGRRRRQYCRARARSSRRCHACTALRKRSGASSWPTGLRRTEHGAGGWLLLEHRAESEKESEGKTARLAASTGELAQVSAIVGGRREASVGNCRRRCLDS
jgi:hypothetical protein